MAQGSDANAEGSGTDGRGAGGSQRGPGGAASRAGSRAGAASSRGGSGGSGSGGSGGSRKDRRRSKAVPIKKPFPVGFAAGVAVLVLGLGAILFYAVANTGSGFESALDRADQRFTGLRMDDDLDANHTNPSLGQRVDYPSVATRPPDGGNHNPLWQTCSVYTEPLVNEHAVHSLEHGAVWLTYQPELPADQVMALTSMVQGNPFAMLSPYPGQADAVMATSWGRQISAPSASDEQLAEFLEVFAPIGDTQGPQTREVGATCTGQVELPGTVPFVAAPDGASVVPGPADGPLVPVSGSIMAGDEPGSTPSVVPPVAPPSPEVTETPPPPGPPATTAPPASAPSAPPAAPAPTP